MGTDGASVDPRREARERVGHRFDVRVLEPSPPASATPPLFADDPVQDADGSESPVLAPAPVAGAATTWDDLAREEPELAPWCADRWLGAWRPLVLPSDGAALVATRTSWHTLAEHVVAPARHRANGKIGLRFTRGGFGTPFFGADEQARVGAAGLTHVVGGAATLHPVTSVRARPPTRWGSNPARRPTCTRRRRRSIPMHPWRSTAMPPGSSPTGSASVPPCSRPCAPRFGA